MRDFCGSYNSVADIQCVLMVTAAVLKQLECEADYSYLSSAKVKNTWSLAASPHGVVTEWFQ
jgi:hypothetical protein